MFTFYVLIGFVLSIQRKCLLIKFHFEWIRAWSHCAPLLLLMCGRIPNCCALNLSPFAVPHFFRMNCSLLRCNKRWSGHKSLQFSPLYVISSSDNNRLKQQHPNEIRHLYHMRILFSVSSLIRHLRVCVQPNIWIEEINFNCGCYVVLLLSLNPASIQSANKVSVLWFKKSRLKEQIPKNGVLLLSLYFSLKWTYHCVETVYLISFYGYFQLDFRLAD